ncbi:MAG: hypothetical protein JW795_06260 [Chitinivibrionales bacterium]|nr:hypothetical protein [Chitinivibrionales bacterium]
MKVFYNKNSIEKAVKRVVTVTELLYYLDPYQFEFDATILESVPEAGLWKVVLDKTCFFPGGGGQPADKGTINGVTVVSLKKENSSIIHLCNSAPGEGVVHGIVDAVWRKDYMQQHTGQHIISASLMHIGQFKTVSVHFGQEHTTIEIDGATIDSDQIEAVEQAANAVINRNLTVESIWTTNDALGEFNIRRLKQQEGAVRLIQVADFDCVGCGGVHCRSSGEVGMVKAVGMEKIRGHSRIAWKIGNRAFADYGVKNEIIIECKKLLTAHEDDLVDKLRNLQSELTSQKRAYSFLQSRLAAQLAENLLHTSLQGSAQTEGKELRIVTHAWQQEDEALVRAVMKSLISYNRCVVCFVNIQESALQWSVGCSQDVQLPFQVFQKELCAIIDGKGGGNPPLWQGMGRACSRSQEFLDSFVQRVSGLKL